MNIFSVIEPILVPNDVLFPVADGFAEAANVSEVRSCRNVCLATRNKLCNMVSKDGSNLSQYVVLLEEYVAQLHHMLSAVDAATGGGRSTNVFQLSNAWSASWASQSAIKCPWKLPITESAQCKWSVFHELQIAVVALSLVYNRLGSEAFYAKIYPIESNYTSATKTDLEQKWHAITEKFFKKSLSIIAQLAKDTSSCNFGSDVLETKHEFVAFVSSYLEANFQLVVVIRNFWGERFANLLKNGGNIGSYNLENLDNKVYKENNYSLLIKIAAFVHSEILGLIQFLDSFVPKQKRMKILSSAHVLDSLFDDSDSEDDAAPGPRMHKLNECRRVLGICLIYIRVYLCRYLSIDEYVLHDSVGKSLSLLNYAMSLVSESTRRGKLKSKLKKNRKNQFVSVEESVNSQFLAHIRKKFAEAVPNSGYYDKVLTKSGNKLILADLQVLVLSLGSLKYKFGVQNDNINFEKVDEMSAEQVAQLLPLGRKMPIALKPWHYS